MNKNAKKTAQEGAAVALFKNRLKKRRDELGWSQEKASEQIGVNLRTYQYWEKGDKPPRPTTLSQIAQKMEVPPAYFYDENWKPLVIREIGQIIERESLCSDFWIMKTGKPFLSAEHPETRLAMIDLMLNKGVKFHFVYAEPSETGLPGDACASFEKLLGEIESHENAETLKKCAEGLPIRNEGLAYELGLCDEWMTFVLAEYNREGRKKYNKAIDVWIEFSREVDKGLGKIDREGLWLELSRDEARSWHARRKPLLELLRRQAATSETKTEQKMKER